MPRDADATRGAFVFIDEPEISPHLVWQMKVLDYYKSLFADGTGCQTSQLFCVTHSPFVVYNKNRRNDKVVILARDEEGRIVVEDGSEHYRCDSMSVVEDAPTVYVEGPMEERYFVRAAEVFGCGDKLSFRCVGKSDRKGGKGGWLQQLQAYGWVPC